MPETPADKQPQQSVADSQRREFLKKMVWVPPLIMTLSMKEEKRSLTEEERIWADPDHPLHDVLFKEGSPPPPP